MTSRCNNTRMLRSVAFRSNAGSLSAGLVSSLPRHRDGQRRARCSLPCHLAHSLRSACNLGHIPLTSSSVVGRRASPSGCRLSVAAKAGLCADLIDGKPYGTTPGWWQVSTRVALVRSPSDRHNPTCPHPDQEQSERRTAEAPERVVDPPATPDLTDSAASRPAQPSLHYPRGQMTQNIKRRIR